MGRRRSKKEMYDVWMCVSAYLGFLLALAFRKNERKSCLFLDITTAPGKRNMKIDGRMAALFGHGVVSEGVCL